MKPLSKSAFYTKPSKADSNLFYNLDGKVGKLRYSYNRLSVHYISVPGSTRFRSPKCPVLSYAVRLYYRCVADHEQSDLLGAETTQHETINTTVPEELSSFNITTSLKRAKHEPLEKKSFSKGKKASS